MTVEREDQAENKAALLLGMTFKAVAVREEDDYALRGAALQELIEKDVQAGFLPFFISKFKTDKKKETSTYISRNSWNNIDGSGRLHCGDW